MEITDFLSELELHFPMSAKTEDKAKLMYSYRQHLTEYLKGHEDEYDLARVLHYLIEHYKYAKLPPLAEIIQAMPHGLPEGATDYIPCVDEGEVIIVTMANGYKYLFEISGRGEQRDKIYSRMRRRFGDIKVEHYPKGTCLIGNQVFTP